MANESIQLVSSLAFKHAQQANSRMLQFRIKQITTCKLLPSFFSRGHATVHLAVSVCLSVGTSVGPSVSPAVRTISELQAILHNHPCQTVRDCPAVYPALFPFSLLSFSSLKVFLKYQLIRIHNKTRPESWAGAVAKTLMIQYCNRPTDGQTDRLGRV